MISLRKIVVLIMIPGVLIFGQDQGNQVFGFVSDSTSGEALIGANVFIRESCQWMATDNNGYYVLSDIGLNEVTLVVSYIGYDQYEKQLSFREVNSENLDIFLVPKSRLISLQT